MIFPSAFETPACARFDGIGSVGSVGAGAVIRWGLPKRELAVLRPMTSFPAAQTRISIRVRTTTTTTTMTTSPTTTGTSATLACQVPILAALETLRIPPRIRAPTLHQTLPPILRPPDPTLTHRLDQRITPLQPRHPDLRRRHHLRTLLRHRSNRRPRRRPLGHRNSRRDRHRPRLQRRRRRCSTGTMVLLRRHLEIGFENSTSTASRSLSARRQTTIPIHVPCGGQCVRARFLRLVGGALGP